MKSISDSVIELIIAIIIIIFVILVFFNVLKGLSYAGRPEAKFGYALSGSISFMINPVAQGVSDASTIANYIALGVVAVTTAIGIYRGFKANYDENIEILESAGFSEDEIENIPLKDLVFKDVTTGEVPIDDIAEGVGSAYKKVFLSPWGAGLLAGTISLDVASYFLNNLAHAMQGPILYYLVPEGVVALNLSDIGSSQVNEMLNDLNQSYVKSIEEYCNNPTSKKCQNLYATYLVAKYLFYTFGETLGQSVTIAGNHNEYALLLFDYNSTYNVTLNDVLCMLEMMEYYGYIPLEVMYGDKVIEKENSYNNIACQVLNNVDPNAIPSNSQYSSNVYNKLLVNSYKVDQNGNVNQLSSTSENSPPNDIIIIPGSMGLPNGIIIEYTYEGGNRAILLTSISGTS